ncbi:MAG: hypothetical protein R3B57_02435 [Phycisphaerales bacterium]
MAGRSSKPLFELMSARRASAAASTRVPPAPRVKAPRAPAPEPPPPKPVAEPGARPSITIPTTTLYVAVVVVLALCLLAYVVGYSLGERAGKLRLVQAGLGAEAPAGEPITDPVLEGPGVTPTLQPGSRPAASPPKSTKPPVQEGAPTQVAGGSGPILTPEGRVAVDPRIPETNYLQMGDLPEAQAVSAIRFFAAKGERVIGIPLEDKGSGSNDPWFRLFSLEAPIPSGRFSEMGRERRDRKRRVAEIGDQWRREERGGSDFSSAFYSLYRP